MKVVDFKRIVTLDYECGCSFEVIRETMEIDGRVRHHGLRYLPQPLCNSHRGQVPEAAVLLPPPFGWCFGGFAFGLGSRRPAHSAILRLSVR